MAKILCGHCRQYHDSAWDVYQCSLNRHKPVYRQAVQQPAVPQQVRRTQPKLVTPIEMIKTLRDGRYAVRPDSNTPYVFVRVTRPKRGRWSGTLKIQTQHSESYKDCIIVWPSGDVSVYDNRVDSKLLLIVVDPVTASMNYGRELNRCCCCGRELTDARSRWFGIGPECESKWPEITNNVIETKGDYYPGCDA